MDKKWMKIWKDRRGSATVEAVVGFTVFLFTIFTILGMANFCRTQMLVSAAVDTAAKEMSQYAYFYQMSGLQKFEETLDNNAKVGANNINEVIGTVDKLYSSVTGAGKNAGDTAGEVADMIAKGNTDLNAYKNAVTSISNDVDGIKNGITSVTNAAKQVGSDPLLYMRSIVALIGSEGMEAAKRAVAVPLAKAFVSRHFSTDTKSADEVLEGMGVQGGLDGMNFNLSKIFSDDKHQDIELTVFYRIKLFQAFDWVILEANVSKVAACRAWLAGDDVRAEASSADGTPLGGGTEEEGGEGGEGGDGGNGSTDPTDPDSTDPTEPGSTDPTESTEATDPTEPTVDIEGSMWHSNNPWQVQQYFDNEVYALAQLDGKMQGVDFVTDGNDGIRVRNNEGTAYSWYTCTEVDREKIEQSMSVAYMNSKNSLLNLEQEHTNTNGQSGLEPGTTEELKLVIFVPKNMTDEELEDMEEWAESYAYVLNSAKQADGIEAEVTVEVRRGGGNYDPDQVG